jgi:hypothetical protein
VGELELVLFEVLPTELVSVASEYPDIAPNELAETVAEGGAVSSSSVVAIEKRSCIQETSEVSDALFDKRSEVRAVSGLVGVDRGRLGETSCGDFGDCTR